MLDQSGLQESVRSMIGGTYTGQAGATVGVPLLNAQAARMGFADAGRAWADALVAYGSGATALGAALVPGTLEAKQAALADTLAARFAASTDALTSATGIIAAIGDLWLGVAFPNGAVVTDVLLGQPASVQALVLLAAVPSLTSKHAELSGVLDTYHRTITFTQPGAPPVVGTLL